MSLMNDQELYVDLQPDDPEWIRQRLDSRPGPTRVVLKAIDDDLDVAGHAIGTSLRLRAFDDEDDTEGHAISVHFPSREAATAFRRRLMLTGVLTGTLVVGAAGGIGLANITNDAAGTGAATSAGSAAGMDWTQAERPGQAAASGVSSGEGMDWTQAERPGQAAAADSSDAQAPARGTTPVPE
jgi:hypothetical protein